MEELNKMLKKTHSQDLNFNYYSDFNTDIDLSIDAYNEPATDDKMFGDYDPYEAYFGSGYKYSSKIDINLDE